MDIKDFSKTRNCAGDAQVNNEIKDKFEKIKETPEFKQVEADYGDFVQDFVNNYGNMSEAELMQEMFKLIQQKKAEGTFDAQKIRELAQVVAPMLDDEQRAKMYNLLNYLD